MLLDLLSTNVRELVSNVAEVFDLCYLVLVFDEFLDKLECFLAVYSACTLLLKVVLTV